MTYDSRVRPHQIRPTDADGAAVAAGGPYGLQVVNDGPFGTEVDGLVPFVESLPASLIDAKGDLIVGTADNTAARKAVGTDGQVLTADSASTGGIKWATPSGGSGGKKTAVFKISGTLATGVGATRLYNDTGATWTISSIRASVETAPSGGSVIIDVNKNGVTLFTTQANRPTITTSSNTSGKVTTMDVTSVADGDYLTVDVDSRTTPAANLTVTVVFS